MRLSGVASARLRFFVKQRFFSTQNGDIYLFIMPEHADRPIRLARLYCTTKFQVIFTATHSDVFN